MDADPPSRTIPRLLSRTAAEVPEELAKSIDRTLQGEARRNELAIAWVRALAFVGLASIETLYWLEGGSVSTLARLPTWIYTVLSFGLLVVLARGWHHRAVGIVMPMLDAGFILLRVQTTFDLYPIETIEQFMELTTVGIGAALLIVSGGFRLSRASLATSIVAGLGLYLWFAPQTRLEVSQMVIHVVLLGGLAAATTILTQQVRRAVRSEVARVTLARFLPPTLLEGVHQDPIALITRPRSVQATVLVSDIRGFTQWSEHRSPIDVLGSLNVIQGRLASIVRAHHGMVDKFMGDGMLAVFGTPEEREDHADLAIRAAYEMREAVRELAASGEIDFRIGIGVHTGDLVVGCLGSGVRMEFTVLGDTVNTATRLEALTKEIRSDLLVSAETVRAASDTRGLVQRDAMTLRGREEPLSVYVPGPS
ncbi:MAG: adenylate/guanylate cyclase domain-containing protein [Myxococcales bacterium]|nr:adenylate/guanylate cyclase domain-containing protein [Myxococcales bacterium]